MMLMCCLMLVSQDTIPYKADEDFAITFEFSFNKRGEVNRDDLVLSQVASSTYDRPDNSPLPFMRAKLEILKYAGEEVKIRIIRGSDAKVAKMKLEPGLKTVVFAGFVDDIKDQIDNYNHTILFLNGEGVTTSRIVIEFDEEGFYTVNGKKRGKL